MNVILGAGISGISAGYHLKKNDKEAVIYERRNSWGGHCDSFQIEGFTFDHCVHLSFTKDNYVKQLFSNSTNYITHFPNPINYYNGKWLKHPAQNNLYPLNIDEKVEILKDLIKAKYTPSIVAPNNYEDWLINQYGKVFYEKFPKKYTKKYWTVEASKLTTDWVGQRMYVPTLDEILQGALTDQTPNTYYADEMRYPSKGGFKSFLKSMIVKDQIVLNKNVIEINLSKKFVVFMDGEKVYYENLISSIPLPELVKLVIDIPRHVIEAAEDLVASSVILVSVGLNRPVNLKNLWFYIYDENIIPSRVYSPTIKATKNAPIGMGSYQFEIYHSRFKKLRMDKDQLIDHMIEVSDQMKLFSKKEIKFIDYRELKYANVIFDSNLQVKRNLVKNYFLDNGLFLIGRYGEWDYFWSDQSLLSGKRVVDKLKHED